MANKYEFVTMFHARDHLRRAVDDMTLGMHAGHAWTQRYYQDEVEGDIRAAAALLGFDLVPKAVEDKAAEAATSTEEAA